MVIKLKDKKMILPILYEDYVSRVEEISLIEEDYLWDNVEVYVGSLRSMQEFLILHSPSFYLGGRSISAYMKAQNPSTIAKFAEILKNKGEVSIHLQTSLEVQSFIQQFIGWLDKTYNVCYYRVDKNSFRPFLLHKERAVLLSPENVNKCIPLASTDLIKRIKTASLWLHERKRKHSSNF